MFEGDVLVMTDETQNPRQPLLPDRDLRSLAQTDLYAPRTRQRTRMNESSPRLVTEQARGSTHRYVSWYHDEQERHERGPSDPGHHSRNEGAILKSRHEAKRAREEATDKLIAKRPYQPAVRPLQQDSRSIEFPCGHPRCLDEVPHEVGFIAIAGTNVSQMTNSDECGVEHIISQCEENWREGARFYDSAAAAVQNYVMRNRETWPAVNEYQVAIITIATPLTHMLHLIRQGMTQRTEPGTRKQGWTWPLLHALAVRHHRIQIFDGARIAMDEARHMDADAFAIDARQIKNVNTTSDYNIWRCMDWNIWCAICHMLLGPKSQEEQQQRRQDSHMTEPWRKRTDDAHWSQPSEHRHTVKQRLR